MCTRDSCESDIAPRTSRMPRSIIENIGSSLSHATVAGAICARAGAHSRRARAHVGMRARECMRLDVVALAESIELGAEAPHRHRRRQRLRERRRADGLSQHRHRLEQELLEHRELRKADGEHAAPLLDDSDRRGVVKRASTREAREMALSLVFADDQQPSAHEHREDRLAELR